MLYTYENDNFENENVTMLIKFKTKKAKDDKKRLRRAARDRKRSGF